MGDRKINSDVSLHDAAVIIAASVKAGLPCFLWGKPGIGKSQVVEQVLRQLGYETRVLIASTLNPVDLRGVPETRGGFTHFAPPEYWKRESDQKVAFFFDELNAALPSVQAAFYRIILEGRLDGIDIQDCPRIGAGNRLSDKGVVFRMPTPLANRFVHIRVREDAQSWLDWAYGKRGFQFRLPTLNEVAKDAPIHPFVTAFIEWKKDALCAFNPKSDETAFPTPRSWEYASRILHTGLTGEHLFQALAGCVGVGTATEFYAFLKLRDKLPDPKDIIDGKTDEFPHSPDCLYALSGALASEWGERYRKARTKQARNKLSRRLFDYTLKISQSVSEEFGVIIVRACIAQAQADVLDVVTSADGEFLPEFDRWQKLHGPVLGD